MAGRFIKSSSTATTSAIIIVSLLTVTRTQGQCWQECYPNEFAKAYAFLEQHFTFVDSFAVAHGHNVDQLYSIVAPEVGHYLVFRDVIETSIVELLYVEMGSDHGNFSIGPFQMQPAFAEKVERYVRLYRLSRFYPLIHPPTSEGRSMRIRKMGGLAGSLEYLCAFISIIEKMHFSWKVMTPLQKLILTATAYNGGFEKKDTELVRLMGLKTFPRLGQTKFSYKDMVTEFYNYRMSTR